MALEHRLLIYVFRRRTTGMEYLFERRRPRAEFAWSPIPAEVGPTESLWTAALRQMRAGWKAPGPTRWIELNVCGHQSVGDLDLIDWAAGYGVVPGWEPADDGDGASADLVWKPLPLGLKMLEEEGARRALVRLHLEAAS